MAKKPRKKATKRPARRDHVVAVRLSPDEYDKLVHAAGLYIAPSVWARAAVLEAVEKALKKGGSKR